MYFPRLSSPRHTLRVEGRQSLVYDRQSHAYGRVTDAEAFLLAASAAPQIAPPVARRLLADRIGKRPAQLAFAGLVARELLAEDRGFAGRVIELEAVGGAFSSPLVAHLGVTLACNFSCGHCYSSSGRRAKDELERDEIFGLVDQLEAMGCLKLVLGGGEPFLRRELEAIVRYADGRGVDTFVHTNASLLDPRRLAVLAECPPAGLSVSIDGPDQASNDAIRGPGTFPKILAGLDTLRRHYPPGFNVSATISARNADRAPELVALAQREGAKLLLLRPAYPAGEALSDPLMSCDRDTFARAIDAARRAAAELGMALDAPHPYEEAEPDFEGFGCVAARVVLGITPTGEVTPCLNLPSTFTQGSLRHTPLLDLWHSGGAFREIREVEPSGDCQSCAHFDTCRGGCRVRALHAGHGLGGTDAWCHYEPREGAAPPRPPAPSRARRLAVVT